MRLFCDQNIPLETVEFLHSLGYDTLSTRVVGMSRADDEDVLRYAIREDRTLLTFNSDFSDLRVFPPDTHCGIIRRRLHQQTAEALHPILERDLRQLGGRDLAGRLVTVKANSVRTRRGLSVPEIVTPL